VFSEEAAAFERWARSDIAISRRVRSAFREALVRITRLYLAVLSLPEPQGGRLAVLGTFSNQRRGSLRNPDMRSRMAQAR